MNDVTSRTYIGRNWAYRVYSSDGARPRPVLLWLTKQVLFT
eukprot:COSAG02_NODE_4182_length_5656_cov_2.473097_6_plen_41_part_00